MIRTKTLLKIGIENQEDFKIAQQMFNSLVDLMSKEHIQAQLDESNKLFTSSLKIQEIIIPKLVEMGFVSEKKGLFKKLSVSQLRPDFYFKIDNERGIIVEVERGKTLSNNMDLLDLWKCHICDNANFLILVIPNIRYSAKGSQKIFEHVEKRISTFFIEGKYTNVDSVFIIGY